MTVLRTRIKVCGITDRDQALAIASLGVDALGFIFVAASPRCVAADQVRDIVAALPPFVTTVGVFMDHAPELVNQIARSCGLSMVQLHGKESPEYCRTMELPVIKAFRVRPDALPDLAAYRQVVKGFLLDTYRAGQAGGTGATFDWQLVGQLSLPGPLILAGGLTADNVGPAISQLRPFAVDANSGVELSPGNKNLELVKRLVAEARLADLHHPAVS